jgi:hypothetical protein
MECVHKTSKNIAFCYAGRKSVITEAKSVSKNVQRGLNSEVRSDRHVWDTYEAPSFESDTLFGG